MVSELLSHELWLEYLEYKTQKQLLSRGEEAFLRDYIENKRYLPTAEKVVAGTFHFSVPEKRELNKIGSSKKRTVYCFSDDENMLLKMLSYLLYRYDGALSENLYSFRKESGARKAFMKIKNAHDGGKWYGFKADISNYFNSIDVSVLLPIVRNVITDDDALVKILTDLISGDEATWQGEVIHESRGVMAGTPTSPFLANLYLKEMDAYFEKENVLYARYSDDILIFSDDEEKLGACIDAFRAFLKKYHLTSNPSKEQYFAPGEKWNFLGFEYDNGVTDISGIAAKKLLDKIRRAAKSIRRWMLKKNVSSERALKAFNRKFNRKFYNAEIGKELCWCRWYFPVINTAKSLKYLDRYMQDWQRYIVTGKHNKTNYKKVPYETLKKCGYRPLTPEYYKRKAANKEKGSCP